MKTRHNKTRRHNKKNTTTRKRHSHHRNKKWVTAIDKAADTFKKTNSFNRARLAFRKQALFNARKLFGSV